MIKVSIILPIFNVAPYLEEAFQSIICQTLKEIEIIAVNDGSTDNSEEIINKFKEKDSRIISFYQYNQGQSVARNLALKYARGKYFYMMDSDVVLSNPKALQICYEYAEKHQADFIYFDGESFSEKAVLRTSWNTNRTHLLEEAKSYNGEFLLNMMLDNQKHNCVVWLLMINHNYLNKIGLNFIQESYTKTNYLQLFLH